MSRLLAVPLLVLPLSAAAQSDDDSPPREVRYSDVTEIDIEALDVTATTVGPSMTFSAGRAQARFVPRLPLRADFDQEVAESVDLLR